jgi:CheY-like chemotaxis protein/nitrogen-specific signal transduction histidine kinase
VAAQRDELKTASEEIARLLAESREYAEALQDADRRKDEFLAMLAHELRNPLAPVRNAVEILRMSAGKPEDLAFASEIISRQVSHMARLVDDLLDVARIARGAIQLRLEPCDLAAVVQQTAEDYRPTLNVAGLNLTVECPADPLMVQGDGTRLAQSVGNLLHNASKFTPAGGRVEVCVKTDARAGQAVITVSDNGAGLDPQVLPRLFQPFNQAAQSLDRSKGGLGLGLALVRGLVHLHGGSVAAHSSGPGQGSLFTLRLPLSSTEPSTDALAEPAESQAASQQNDSLQILVIEDNRDAAVSLRMLLSHLGHQVTLAHDGVAGLAAARKLHPDVIISDLGLPGEADGYAVARGVRQDSALAAAYLVALSGYGQEDDRKRTQEAGFNRHLVKPVQLAELQEALAAARARQGA